ncbi:trimeric autotransporter adhesin AtaA-like [Haliotis asinina]|uniref:trimeric autotransporter adhesin AtaA-like n=1 Tax=Haliotis asinina TaxID=109174 RepID=UPI00353232CB
MKLFIVVLVLALSVVHGQDVLTGLKGDLQTIGGAIKQTGKDFVPYAQTVGKDLLGTLKNDTLKMVGNTISDLLGQAISKLFHTGKRDTITERDVVSGLKDDLQTIGGAIKETGKDFVPYAASLGKDLLGTFKNDTLKMIGDTISDLLGQAISKLFHTGKRDTVTERDVLTGIKDDLETIGGAIKQTGQDFVPYAAGVGKDLLGTLKNDTLKMVGGTITDLLGQAFANLFHFKRELSEEAVLNDILEDMDNDTVGMIGDVVAEMIGHAIEKLFHKKKELNERDVLSGLKDEFQTIGGAIKQTGQDFVPFATGIGKDLLGTLENDTLKMVGGTITDLLGHALANLFHGKRDLSKRDFLTDIRNDLQTIGGAVQQTGKDFVPFAAGIGKDLLGTLQNDTLKMVGGTISDLLGQALSNLFQGKRDLSKRDFLTDIKNDLQTIGGAVQQTGKDFVPFAAGIGKDLLGTLQNDTLKMVGGTISDLLGQALSNLFQGKRDLSERDLLTDIKNDLQTIGGAVQQTGKDFVPYAAGIGKDLLGTLENDTLKMVGGTISDLLGQALVNLFHGKRDISERNLLTDIKNDVEAIGGAVIQTGKDFIPFAAGVGKDLLGTALKDSAKMVGGTISDLGDAFSKLFGRKRDLLERNLLTDIKNDLQTIGGAFKQTGQDFVPYAAGVGKDLLGTLLNDSAKIVGGTVSDLLGQALSKLFHGKRDLSQRDVLTGLKDDINTIGGAIEQTGKDFVPYAANVGKGLLDTLKNDTLKMVGGTITDLLGKALSNLFHFKRDTPNLVQQSKSFMSELKNLLDLGTSQFSDVIDEVFAEIQTIYSKVKTLEMHSEDAEKKIDAVAAKYRSLVTDFVQALERDVTKVVTRTFGQNKRDLAGGLGSSLTGLFKPGLEAIGKMVLQPTLHPPMHEPILIDHVSASIEKYVHSLADLIRANITQSLIAESL